MSDLVEKQAAIDALEKEKPTPFVDKDGSIDPFGAGRQNQWYRDGIAIMSLPSAQPDRKKGKWIEVDVGDCCYRCSECGFIRDAYLLDIGNYCPKCGAKMSEEEENEN